MEKTKGEMKARYFFLFTDCLVHTKPKKGGNTYTFKRFTPLKKVMIGEVLDSSSKCVTASLFTPMIDDKHPIKLVLPEGSEISLFAENEEEKKGWLTDIGKILEVLNSTTTFLAGGAGVEHLKRLSFASNSLKDLKNPPPRSASSDRVIRKSPSQGPPPATQSQTKITPQTSQEDVSY